MVSFRYNYQVYCRHASFLVVINKLGGARGRKPYYNSSSVVVLAVMVADSHRVRVTYESPPNFLARLGNSCVGILVGLVVVIGGCTLLFWNEVRKQ